MQCIYKEIEFLMRQCQTLLINKYLYCVVWNGLYCCQLPGRYIDHTSPSSISLSLWITMIASDSITYLLNYSCNHQCLREQFLVSSELTKHFRSVGINKESHHALFYEHAFWHDDGFLCDRLKPQLIRSHLNVI